MKRLDGVDALEAKHRYVHDHDIEIAVGDGLDPAVAILHMDDVRAFELQPGLYGRPDRLVVDDSQNLCHGGSHHVAGPETSFS